MEVLEYKETAVQRDMDLIRNLLLNIEGDPRFDGLRWYRIGGPADLGIDGHSAEEVGYHLNLLIEAGFLKGRGGIEAIPPINKLTWQGHEFADNLKDAGIWGKTKDRLLGLPGVALSIVAAVLEAEVKKHLGNLCAGA